jgi:uncharacterized SAM-binding protein YcdF (DUF218 family)
MLAKLLTALISPLGTALTLWLTSLYGTWRGGRRWPSGCLIAGGVWLWVWSMPVISLTFRAHLEGEFPPRAIQSVPAAPAMVVLGGAMTAIDADHLHPGLNAAADRVWEAARLYHAGKAPLLLLSGGSDPAVSLTPESAAMRQLLRDLGVPETAMIEETRSRTTRENARYSAGLLKEQGIRRILLVTSALHMHRARACFEREDLEVEPAATDYEGLPASGLRAFIPDAGALDGSARAIKEWVGRWAS